MNFKKIIKYIKQNKYLLAIFVVGLFLRLYGAYQNLDYSHDQDLASWFVRDVVENKHLRLIGQETSTQGVFIGPTYYYLLTIFYILFGMSPVGGIAMVTLLGLFTIWSFYFVFKKVFGKNEGLIAAAFYSLSFATVYNDREVVPTTPVFLWTVWYFYSLNLLIKGKFKDGLVFVGILIGLIWHLNVGLVLLTPLVAFALLFKFKKLKFSYVYSGIISFLITSLPFILFEVRHGFSQIKYVITSFTTNQGSALSHYSQFLRVVHIATQNATTLIYNPQEKYYLPFTILLIAAFVYLIYRRIITKQIAIILICWQILYVIFFSFYSKNLSEYYLNGMTMMWFVVIALFVNMFVKKHSKIVTFVGLAFALLSFYRLDSYPYSDNGYIYKQALVQEIKSDALQMGYPCVSVSYITNPGYDRGYRYLFLMNDLKLKPISDKVPVYSIVFPMKKIFPTDKSFGTIGLIYPEYEKYNIETITEACEGGDFNLEDSMIGFTN